MVFSSCFLSDKIYNLHFESAIYLVRFAIVISKCKKATAAFKYIVTERMECATSETGTDPGNTWWTTEWPGWGLGVVATLSLHSNAFTYLVYGVLKCFFLRVGLGQRVSMMLCELHSPIPPPLESRFMNEHSDCNKHGEHNYWDHDWYNIRALSGGT